MEGKDRRRAVRVTRPIEVQYSQNCPFIEARAADLSETGLFLETQHPLENNSEVTVRFSIPDGNDLPITVAAKVLWTDPLVGVGVEFHDLSADQRERIKYWVAEVFFSDPSARSG